MGKRSQRRIARHQENNIGCMWSLIQMFYFRRDAKYLLDRKQGSRRHTFSGFAGRGHSRKKSRDFEEIDEDGENMEECSMKKPTVKRLMEAELGKVKPAKKIPNDEVQRILADLGHDVCLDKSSTQNSKPNGVKNYNTRITMASPSNLLDPSSSKSMKQGEEDDPELSLADFLEQIYRHHDEWPHDDCNNKSELCPDLKNLIDMKLNEFKNVENELAFGKHLCNSRLDQRNKLTDTLEMLSSDKDLFLKKLQKPNSHTLEKENIQKHQNRDVITRLEPRKMVEKTNFVEDTNSSNQHELEIKTKTKESKHIFFWKKDKSIRSCTSEGTNNGQSVNKIVILKPNTRRGIDSTTATASTSLQQQSRNFQAPEYSATDGSKFSIKEVRRRFRIVTGESRRGKPSVYEDDLQRDPHLVEDSVFTIRKDSRHVHEQTSAQKASGTDKDSFRPSTSRNKKQRNDGLGEINRDMIISKDTSIFYEEAKKHLKEILKYKSQTSKYPTVQISKPLVGMLSLPQCNTSSPRSSPRVKDCIDHSSEEANISAIHKVDRGEPAKEISQSEEDSGSVTCGTSEALDDKAVQEGHSMENETTQYGDEVDIMCTEEIDKPDCSERISNARTTPSEQCRCYSPLEMMEGEEIGKEQVEMFPSYPENVVQSPEQEEPKTPRSSASLDLISHTSLEGNQEKQEQPSPVSVLDPFFQDDVDSPDSKTVIKCELHQDIMRPQYTPHSTLDEGIFWEDKDARLGYIKAVLELSELCTYQNLEVWYLEDELISPCLFEELHQGNQTDDLKLLFDCICEAIAVIQGTYFRPPPCSFLRHNIQTPPMGQNLISEINKYIEGHLHYQFPSTLHQLASMDLEDGTWMNLRLESEDNVVDIWEFILYELLEEVTYDLWIEASVP